MRTIDGIRPGSQYCPPLVAASAKTRTATYTWTEHTFTCTVCRKLTRASREAINEQRENADCEGMTDSDVVSGFEFCLKCVSGILAPGEHVCHQCGGEPGADWDGNVQLTQCPTCSNWLCSHCSKEPCDHGEARFV